MVLSLNKFLFVFIFLLSSITFAQKEADDVFRPQDYKDQAQFKHFRRNRQAVAKWQINQLRDGALVVRLHDNLKTVEALRRTGKSDLATQREYHYKAININIVRAFTKYFKFAKVYFMFSQYSDSLLNGARKGIFVDTNLVLDPNIEMTEKFYMLGERCDIYNSSIGFVKEDTARKVKETGSVVGFVAFVLKNKYGHQVKEPFPVWVNGGSYLGKTTKYVNVTVGSLAVPVELEEQERVEKHYYYVVKLNKQLISFYNSSMGYQVTNPEIIPFLY